MFRAMSARLLKGARASSVTAARVSMCIVSHRCPRGPVHCQSPLPTSGHVHLVRQSPLLKGACASSVTAARVELRAMRARLLEGARASSVTAARVSMCEFVAAALSVELVRRQSPLLA